MAFQIKGPRPSPVLSPLPLPSPVEFSSDFNMVLREEFILLGAFAGNSKLRAVPFCFLWRSACLPTTETDLVTRRPDRVLSRTSSRRAHVACH